MAVTHDKRYRTEVAQGKRSAHKQRTRNALEEAAWALFEANGYDETSVAAIAQQVGVSERTFYRYFESKEAVLFSGWEAQLAEFVTFVEARPAEEPLVRTLKEFSQGWALMHQGGLGRTRQRYAISEASERVRDYERTRVLEVMRIETIELLAARLGVSPKQDYRPVLLASLFIEVLFSAKKTWIGQGGSLLTHIHAAWEAVAQLFPNEKKPAPG